MRLAVPKEIVPGETRVALVPESVKKLRAAGMEVSVEAGAGAASSIADDAFQAAGATIAPDRAALLKEADFVLKVQCPRTDPSTNRPELDGIKEGALLLGTLQPTINLEAMRFLRDRKVTAFSTDCIPRVTRAQTMDTLSSMASLAGYKAVLLAANELPKYFPMFMTAAGTVLPAKVFVIGAGVAGLQAIATAKRLGASVEGTDTRPAAKGDIESLGAKFVGVISEQAQDAGGYAKELTAEFYQKQAELIGRECALVDVVITTALIGGIKAPKLITEEMVSRMKPGAVIVDLAAPGGGNCEASRPGETIVKHGVKILAPLNLPAEMPVHASLLYSRNLTAFLLAFWDAKQKEFKLDFEDEILKGAVVTHAGEVRHSPTREALSKAG